MIKFLNTHEWVVLWTDALVYILLASILLFFFYIIANPDLRAPWKKIFKRPLNMAAIMILSAYILVGILDSVHFKPAEGSGSGNQIVSLFDYSVIHWAGKTESSYSAPFATHLYTKNLIEMPNGEMVRDYPQLVHVNANQSIGWLAAKSVFFGVLMSGIIFLIFRQFIFLGYNFLPWKTVALVLFTLVTIGIFIQWASPHYHILGTDKVGEDVLYQSLKSIRTGLVIGTVTTLIMVPFAVILGLMAGFYRGFLDDIIQYIYTTLSSIPSVLLIAAAVLTLQVKISEYAEWFPTQLERSDARLLALCIILGITSWTGLCRLLRGEALKLRSIEYVQAAQVLGVRSYKIMLRHLLPNVMHIILIAIALDFSGLVLAEAVLSYVGVGVDPASYSWGTMINAARLELAREPMVWWSLLSAFVFMFMLVLSANVFSDALRDAYDPRTVIR